MIEINLLEQKKPMRMPIVLGIDLNVVNLKLVVLAIFLNFIVQMLLSNHWDEEFQERNINYTALQSTYQKLAVEVQANSDVQRQLVAYNEQVQKLKQRSIQVDKIVRQKSNPKKLLERLARNLPEDLWFSSLEIFPSREILIKGGATSYKSIGNFIISSNESPFFGGSLALADSSTQEDIFDGIKQRIEIFEVKGKIETFESWSQ